MIRFIKKTASIIIAFLLGLLIFIIIIHVIVKFKSDFSLDENSKYLIFGHSHTECAFNDGLIKNFKNLSLSGESYFYTYQKVKNILNENEIKAIFIEYSNNQIDEKMDKWIWGFEKMNAYFPVHSPFMNKTDILFLYEKNHQDFPIILGTSTRHNLTRILSFNYSIDANYGGYLKLDKNEINKLVKQQSSTDTIQEKEQNLSKNNINYLENIIAYCNEKNCKVYFIRSPQHENYPRLNEKKLLEIKEKRFKNTEFLDFDKFPLKDYEFGDFGHINYKGAQVFSLWFNTLVENGLLSSDDKSSFIEAEIQKAQTNARE